MSNYPSVKRPAFGNNGEEIRVIVNFLRLRYDHGAIIYHYRLDYDSIIKNALQIQGIYRTLISNKILPQEAAFDSRHSIFVNKSLDFTEKTIQLQLDSNNKSTDLASVQLKLVGSIPLESLTNFVNGAKVTNTEHLQSLMALNVIINQEPAKRLLQIGNVFYTNQRTNISGGLELRQGFFQSCRPGQKEVFVNVDAKVGAFYKPVGLIQSVFESLKLSKEDVGRKRFNEMEFRKVCEHVVGLNIFVTHMGEGKTRRYKVMGVSKKTPKEYKFKINNEGAEELTTDVEEYFYKNYNYRIQYPNLPCIVVNKENCLPMEVCKIAADQRYPRKLDEKQTSEMIKETAQPPNERLKRIVNGVHTLGFDNFTNKSFELDVEKKLIDVGARILKPPRIQYNPRSRVNIRDASWNLNGVKLMQGGTIDRWTVLYFENPKDNRARDAIEEFARDLSQSCKNLDIAIRKAPVIQTFNPMGDLEFCFRKYIAPSNPQLIVCVIPNNGSISLYSELKRIGDTIIGVPTQCVVRNKIYKDPRNPKKVLQYLSNVGLKINSKIGGSNMQVMVDDIKVLKEEPTLLIGADVTHPGARDKETCSVAAVVGSMDKFATKYSSVITSQPSKMEIIDKLDETVAILIKRFSESQNTLPQRLIFYRDGVSEGQYQEVYSKEITSVLKSFDRVKPGYKPKLTFIIATKRHHMRMFPMSVNDRNNNTHKTRSGNCMPGTVVENTITHPTDFDFYLQSHAGIKGTSRSCHYTILYDDNRFTSDEIQLFTYYLCYTFSRCTSAVSLATPVYYAHLCAARARHHVTDKKRYDSKQTLKTFTGVHPNIANKMFFV